MASRADRPSRREIALALPALTLLGRGGPLPGLPTGEDGASPAGSTTAILLRHAEKDAGSDPKDPGLSSAGLERARALQRLLARAGATHLFASEYRRTRETLAPVAEARAIGIESIPAADLAGLVARLRALPAGSVAVVAGHSNTVPAIASALGGSMKDLVDTASGPALRDDEYARLAVLTWPTGRAASPSEGNSTAAKAGAGAPWASLLELAYGA